jgi:hypothetical protein
VVDPTCTLAQQALMINAVTSAFGGYTEVTNALRLAEVSLTYTLPAMAARRFLHANSASVTFAGRNVALWTNYSRRDPNVDGASSIGDADSFRDGFTVYGQPRNWTIRINLGY